jgi:putative sterol carrier protein
VDLKCAEPYCKKLKGTSNGNGTSNDESFSPDLDVTVSEEDLIKVMNNDVTPQQAFMKGMLKIKGKMSLAMKLAVITSAAQKEAAKPKSKL